MVHFASGVKNQQQSRPSSAGSNSSAGDKDLAGNLELGELGQLTITNDNESSYDVSKLKQSLSQSDLTSFLRYDMFIYC